MIRCFRVLADGVALNVRDAMGSCSGVAEVGEEVGKQFIVDNLNHDPQAALQAMT